MLLQPLFLWHLNFKDDIQIATMVWIFVYWHSFSSKYYCLSRLDNFACRARNAYTSSVKMIDENAVKTKESL